MGELIVLPRQWSGWKVVGLLGSGSFAKVYLAEKIEYGERFLCAIKHISISNRKQENLELFAEGIAGNANDVSKYCGQIKSDLIHEIKTNYEVRGNSNIVCYSDHVVEEKADGSGYDVYIMMEYLKSLSSVISERGVLTTAEVLRIGIDMCSALEVLGAKNIIHRDIKPGNIFVNSEGVYKLGDFGVAKVLDKTASGMSIKGTVSYMAPEIFLSDKVDKRSDIYSLGLVLYRLLNNNKPPFVDTNKNGVTHDDNSASFHRRVGGEQIPYPMDCSDRGLVDVIMKACDYRPENRWQTASEMKEALLFVKNGGVNNAGYLRPVLGVNPDYSPYQQYDAYREYMENDWSRKNAVNGKNGNNSSYLKLILSGVAAVCVVVIISAVLIMNLNLNSGSNNYIDRDFTHENSSESFSEKTEGKNDVTEESSEKTVFSDNHNSDFYTPTEKPTVPHIEEKTEPAEEKSSKVCFADVKRFLTVRMEADSTSQAIVFVPPLTSMTILNETPVNGMLLVSVDATKDVGYVNTKYICYSREAAKEEAKNSSVKEFFYPKNRFIHIVKKNTVIYDGKGKVEDNLKEDELVYIVNIIDSEYVEVLFIDSELPYYRGVAAVRDLEITDGC